jgi:hypothetical protein
MPELRPDHRQRQGEKPHKAPPTHRPRSYATH